MMIRAPRIGHALSMTRFRAEANYASASFTPKSLRLSDMIDTSSPIHGWAQLSRLLWAESCPRVCSPTLPIDVLALLDRRALVATLLRVPPLVSKAQIKLSDALSKREA